MNRGDRINNCFDELQASIPNFDIGRCDRIRRLESWKEYGVNCLRIVLDYAGQFDIVLVAKKVHELPLIAPSTAPGVLPFVPYDLGELLVTVNENGILLFDELKSWRLVAESLELESIVSNSEG